MTMPGKRRAQRNRPGEKMAAALLASGPAPCDHCENRPQCAQAALACHEYADYVSGIWPPSTDRDLPWKLSDAESRQISQGPKGWAPGQPRGPWSSERRTAMAIRIAQRKANSHRQD